LLKEITDVLNKLLGPVLELLALKTYYVFTLKVFFVFLLILPWCKEKQIQTLTQNMTVGQQDTNLRRFYTEARKKSGELYSRSSLLGFRDSVERYLNATPLS